MIIFNSAQTVIKKGSTQWVGEGGVGIFAQSQTYLSLFDHQCVGSFHVMLIETAIVELIERGAGVDGMVF